MELVKIVKNISCTLRPWNRLPTLSSAPQRCFHRRSAVTTRYASNLVVLLPRTTLTSWSNKPHSFLIPQAKLLNHTKSLSESVSKNEPEKPRPNRENIFTVPNVLCVSRIIACPYLATWIANGHYDWAFGLFVYAGFTDLADGWIARNFEGQASMLGSFLDPLADKILVATLYLSLTYVDLIPVALTSLVVSRDVLLVYAGLYIRYMGVPPPFTIKKYFDISLPSAQVQPTTISKINTAVQLVMVASALAAPILGVQDHPALMGLCLLTATTTFASAVSYAFMKDTYKFSHREYDHQFGKKLTAFIIFILFNLAFVYSMPQKQKKPVESPANQ